MILSRTPLRICLAGGGTDLPSYYENNGSMFISMAINKYIYLSYKPDDFEKLLKLRYSKIEIVDNVTMLQNHRARQALLNHGIYHGCEINSSADLPSNTGLGSSGSFLVGLLNCIREYKQMNREPQALAEEAFNIEHYQLNEPVGKQDQYIAAFGGITIFNIDNFGKVAAQRLNIDPNLRNGFLSNLCVYYLNLKRDASDILQEQSKLKGNTEKILDTVLTQAHITKDLLENGDFDAYGRLMDEYWQLKKQLSNKITIPIVDEIYEVAKQKYNVLGGKVIGAGGGGFLLLYCNKDHSMLDSYMKSLGFPRLHFNVDNRGSTILGNFMN